MAKNMKTQTTPKKTAKVAKAKPASEKKPADQLNHMILLELTDSELKLLKKVCRGIIKATKASN